LVGRTDLLKRKDNLSQRRPKAASMNVEALLYQHEGERYKKIAQNHHLDEGFDLTQLLPDAQAAIEQQKSFTGNYVVKNEQRDVGVITGSMITDIYGA